MSGLVIKSIYIIIGKTGIFTTYLIPIFIAVFILVALGDALPIFFNNYTFCVYTIAIANPVQDTIEWTIVMLLGGAFYASAMLLLFHLFLKQDPEEKNESTTGLDVI
jgi:cobalamin biosynthesis Co2+ chelatase CbiK